MRACFKEGLFIKRNGSLLIIQSSDGRLSLNHLQANLRLSQTPLNLLVVLELSFLIVKCVRDPSHKIVPKREIRNLGAFLDQASELFHGVLRHSL